MAELLALLGGPKTKTSPFSSGRRFTEDEISEVTDVLQGNSLFYRTGGKTNKLEAKMCEMYDVKYAVASSSGTAGIHCAVAALGIGPGHEVLVPAVTDMGSIIGILYQGAIPVFMDIDEDTFNFDIKDFEKKITKRTKAVMVVHYMGNPCDMDEILRIARNNNISVIEDCAQSPHARYKGKLVGTMGDVGCFSFNDFKHISTGEGGICITDDLELAKRIRLYSDKAYNRETGAVSFSDFLAPNYRISELCSAVAIAQLDKLEWITGRRNRIAQEINKELEGVNGLYPMIVSEGSFCSNWFFLARLEEKEFGASRDVFLEALTAEGIPCSGSHVPEPIYRYGVLKNLNAFPGCQYPFRSVDFNSDYSYEDPDCPNAQKLLDKTVKIVINEFYSDEDVEDICKAIRKIAGYYAGA